MNWKRLLLPVSLVGVVVFGLLALLGGPGNKAAQQPVQEKTTPVAVAKVDIPQGAEIGIDMLEMKPLTDAELQNVPEDAVRERDPLVGGRAKVLIPKGDFLTPTNTELLSKQFSGGIEPGFVAVTFPAPPKPSLYDLKFLNPDDRVDVFGVYLDQGTGDTVSVRLASNVRLLAVDKIKSQAEEELRKKKLQEQIDAATAQLTAARNRTTPPPTTDELDGYQKQIDALNAQMNPEIPEEEQSLTVEVTPAQSQKIAMWRQSADVTVALHRENDAAEMIYGNVASLEGLPAGEPGTTVVAAGAPQGQILTMDDVVPLDRRDPAKYYQEQQAAEQHREMQADRRLLELQRRADEIETEQEIKNLLRYGTRQRTDLPSPSYLPGPGPSPATSGPGGLTKRDLQDALGGVNKRLGALEQKVDGRSTATAQPKPLRGSVEIYRGKEKTVEQY